LDVGRNKLIRAIARTSVAYMDVGKGREQERKLFRQMPPKFAGNATSRYALGWPYSGLRRDVYNYERTAWKRDNFFNHSKYVANHDNH